MKLTPKQIDALTELFNIGIGRGASVLNTMLNSNIRLQVPFVKVLSSIELKSEMEKFGGNRIAAVDLRFKGKFSGSAQLVFPADTAGALVTTLVGEDPTDLDIDSIRAGTLCEIGNVVLNGVMGTIANLLELQFSFSVPGYIEETAENLFGTDIINPSNVIVFARTRFVVEELDIEGDIILFLEVNALHELLEAIEHYSADTEKFKS